MYFHVKWFSYKNWWSLRSASIVHRENPVARVFLNLSHKRKIFFLKKNDRNLVLEGEGLDPAGIRLLIMGVKLF